MTETIISEELLATLPIPILTSALVRAIRDRPIDLGPIDISTSVTFTGELPPNWPQTITCDHAIGSLTVLEEPGIFITTYGGEKIQARESRSLFAVTIIAPSTGMKINPQEPTP